MLEKLAPVILSEIKNSKSILLHCHPMSDPDSVGSALAMRFAIEQMDKKVTVIKGDSDIPTAFMHFPGAVDIIKKNFIEIDLNSFDLFISLDSGSKEMVTNMKSLTFPLSIKTIVIDHHITNELYGDINLVDISSPATAFVLFKLFKLWNISISHDIAINLFMGIYTDTGGFRYSPTDFRVIRAASELAEIAPDFNQILFTMENSRTKESIYFLAIALSSVKTFLNDNIAISIVSHKDLVSKNIPEEYVRGISISGMLISVIGWNIGVSMIEIEPQKIKISCRTRDKEKYDVSKLAKALGGGGHKGASGASLNMSLEHGVEKVVETARVLYNL